MFKVVATQSRFSKARVVGEGVRIAAGSILETVQDSSGRGKTGPARDVWQLLFRVLEMTQWTGLSH